ncbi:hypothetical protein [Chromatium okenii]|uniref:hypothetical protein n=1 Tax=Chromatium okenii TaxID=61644 RepID=UPI001F5BF53A|nr:hypothetical protein [Chromatium okenii]
MSPRHDGTAGRLRWCMNQLWKPWIFAAPCARLTRNLARIGGLSLGAGLSREEGIGDRNDWVLKR